MKKRRVKSFIKNMDILHMFVETLSNLYEFYEKENYLMDYFNENDYLLDVVPLSFDEWECTLYYGKETLIHWYDSSHNDYVNLSSKPVIFDKLSKCRTNNIGSNLIKSYDYINRHVVKFLKTLTDEEIQFLNKVECKNYCDEKFDIDHMFNSHNNDGRSGLKDFLENFDKIKDKITRV